MASEIQWEYRAESFGSFWNAPKDEEIEGILNEWGEDGWEVISLVAFEHTNKMRLIAKRPLTVAVRRQREWPG